MRNSYSANPREVPSVLAGVRGEFLNRALIAAVDILLVAALGFVTARAAEVPVINGELGPCTADFTVTDSSNNPLYNAKIHVSVAYGFMSKRKSDLEIRTDSNGKARFEGLPNKVKKPLEFQVSVGDQSKTVTQDPAKECHASFSVPVGTT